MREDPDALMLVRAELCERLDMLQSFATRRPRDIAASLDSIRTLARAYGLTPVVRLADALERAIAEEAPLRGRGCAASLYLDRLHDAIGCSRLDDEATQAIIASVSVRLGA